LGLWE
jgi:hypothetical protein